MNTAEKSTNTRLQEQVDHIVKTIENGYQVTENDYWEGLYEIGDILSAFDYMDGYYNVEYYVNSDRSTVNGARFMVAGGGPNIFIDTKYKTVEGYWWSDKYIARYYDDPMGLEDLAQELWGC